MASIGNTSTIKTARRYRGNALPWAMRHGDQLSKSPAMGLRRTFSRTSRTSRSKSTDPTMGQKERTSSN